MGDLGIWLLCLQWGCSRQEVEMGGDEEDHMGPSWSTTDLRCVSESTVARRATQLSPA